MATLAVIQCPHCRCAMQQADNLAGRIVACPSCGGKFQMPGATATLPVAPPRSQPSLIVRPAQGTAISHRQKSHGGNRSTLVALLVCLLLLIGAGLFAVKMKDNWSLSPVASDKTSSGPWKKAAGGSGDKEATGGASDASPVGEPAKPDKPGKPSSKEAENALKAVRAYLQKKEGNRNVRIVKEYPPESLEGGVFDYTDLKGTFRYPLLNYLESSWPTEPIFDCEVRQFDILNRPMPGQDLTNFVPKYVCNYRLSLGVRVHYEVDLGFGRWEPFDEVFVVSTESRVVGSTKSRNFQKGVPTGKHDPQFDKSISDADYKKQVEQTLLKSYLDRRL